ncbi:MAG: TonB-dependent receptor [Thermodesulfobacteriota bacterium]|nr:TonB-dependent receptor [Thermodesulfobacteriota bacterium]
MKIFKSIATFLIPLLFVFRGNIWAQKEKDEGILTLDEIVVTATKMEKKVKDIPVPIYIVTEEDIKQTDTRNIEEALQKVPGLFTEDKYHTEYNVISFRGIGLHSHVTRGILVLEDGIPINEAMGRVDFEGIDFENVEKIEVLKGPVSALYGPNGISGVINIITKKTPVEFESGIETSVGSFDTEKIIVNGGGRIGELGLRLNAKHYFTHGYRKHNSYKTDKFNTKLDTDLYDYGELSLSMDYITSEKDIAGPLDKEQYEIRSRDNTKNFAYSDIDLMRIGITHKKTWGKLFDLTTNLYTRNKEHEGGYSDTFTSEDELNLFGTEVRLHKSFNLLGRENSLISGISADREDGDSKTFHLNENGNKTDLAKEGTSIYKIIGYYIQDDYNIFDTWTMILGMRYDCVRYDWKDRFLSDGDSSDSTSISALSPKFGLVYTPIMDLTLFGNIGKGFNPPQISQLFIGDYATTPNPDLKPEYLTNYEVGIRGSDLERLGYQISFFLMEFKDQILNDDVTGKYENIGDTRHKGIETTAELQLFETLSFSINYAYLTVRFTDYPGYTSNNLRKTPRHQVGSVLRYANQAGFTADISLKWIDEYYMDNENVNTYKGHCVVNTKLAYEWKRYFTSLSINNLFDTKYATWTSASYERATWTESYYPGWPFNITFTAGARF